MGIFKEEAVKTTMKEKLFLVCAVSLVVIGLLDFAGWTEKVFYGPAEAADSELPFNHSQHESFFKEGSCKLCHKLDKDDPQHMKLVADKICATCHEAGQFQAYKVRHLRKAPSYHHEKHLDLKLKCRDCHKQSRIGTPQTPPMALCISCHRFKGVAGKPIEDCTACHAEGMKDASPETHLPLVKSHKGWPKNAHADEMPPDHTHRFRRVTHARKAEHDPDLCGACHEQKTCTGCHSEMRPRDHTPRWRRTAHGRAASHDRKRCAECHTSDSCSSCHEALPRDHSFAFRERGDHAREARRRMRACLTCHSPAEDCQQCHFNDRRGTIVPGSVP